MNVDGGMGCLGIESTTAKINVKEANEILGRYALRNVEFLVDDRGTVELTEAEVTYPYYPQAVPVGDVPRREDYGDYRAYREAVDDIYCRRGSEGYFALLKELSMCLKSPLTILVVSADPDDHEIESLAWRIEPGSGIVEELSAWAYH
jgi:hypothetical protein